MAKLSELTEATVMSVTDIMHLRTTGGIDKKITFENVLENAIKGYIAINLTNFYTTTVPAIAGGGRCEIDGKLLYNSGTISISGTTVNGNWYGILLTPSGDTYTASFVADNAGSWDETKQGVYSGTGRIVGFVYRDTSGNFTNKNILTTVGRIAERRMDIGAWNMDTTDTVILTVESNGSAIYDRILNTGVFIKHDTQNSRYQLEAGGSTELQLGVGSNTEIQLNRDSGGIFDSLAYNDTGINRGTILMRYSY